MRYQAICTICGREYGGDRPLRGTTCSRQCAGELRRSRRPQRICLHCRQSFSRPAGSKVRFCSIACFNSSPYRGVRGNHDMTRQCLHCGASYRRESGQTSRRFCSRRCAIAAQHGKKQYQLLRPQRGDGRRIGGKTRAQFIKDFKHSFPFCQRCGWKEEISVLHVHHKTRNRMTRKIEELEVLCPNCHFLEHHRANDRFGRNKRFIR